MDIEALKANFDYLLFERIDQEQNEYRFYYLAWQPSLFDEGVIVRIAGRKWDGQQQIFAPLPYPAFEEAWPAIRAIIHKQLRNGYRIVDAAIQIAS